MGSGGGLGKGWGEGDIRRDWGGVIASTSGSVLGGSLMLLRWALIGILLFLKVASNMYPWRQGSTGERVGSSRLVMSICRPTDQKVPTNPYWTLI